MKKNTLSLAFLAACLTFLVPAPAHTLEYDKCFGRTQSAACLIAFEKIKTLINPGTGERYFHDGIHITDDGDLFMFPMIYVATPDLDGDGAPEIIAGVPEQNDETVGSYCLIGDACPWFVIQDRTLPGEKRTLSNFKAFDPIFAYSVALSTDERFDNFRSLRAYKDGSWRRFDVYQYDGQTDQYYNISEAPQP
jgi:hypothetical protein